MVETWALGQQWAGLPGEACLSFSMGKCQSEGSHQYVSQGAGQGANRLDMVWKCPLSLWVQRTLLFWVKLNDLDLPELSLMRSQSIAVQCLVGRWGLALFGPQCPFL